MYRKIGLGVLFTASLLIACAPLLAQDKAPTVSQSKVPAQARLQLELWRDPASKAADNRQPDAGTDKAERLKEGRPIWLKISLKNADSSSLFTNTLQLGSALSLLVRDQNGNRVPLTTLGKRYMGPEVSDSPVPPRVTLSPGGGLAKCFQINSLFDMSVYGSYTVVASLTFPDGHILKSNLFALEVESTDTQLSDSSDEAQEPKTPAQGPQD